jgi:predicted nucleic acid-binding protein
LVIDASVSLKWFFGDLAGEQDAERARALLPHIGAGAITLIQPPHWLLEVLAVVVRQRAELVVETLAALNRLGAEITADDAIYSHAADLSKRFKQHLFDTLYHALALERGATLLTADERYFSAAHSEGAVERLASFSVS